MAVETGWQESAREMRAMGKSEREIAAAVGKAASTVHETVKDVVPQPPNGAVTAEDQEHAVQAKTAFDAERLASLAGDSSGDSIPGRDVDFTNPTPGQLDIDGGETPAAEQVRVEEIIVRGTTPLDFFNAGGKLPNTASLKFVGGKVGLEQGTAFKKADVIKFTGYATVVAATPRDKRDKATGVVLTCELQILAEIDDLQLSS